MITPLIFSPIYRQYLWGGRRFQSLLGRELEHAGPYAESWEIVDRGDDQSIVRYGPLAGRTLGGLMQDDPFLITGISTPSTFPLLFKFLDAHKVLSVQVHPDDEQASKRTPPDRGKTEAWYVVEAEPRSKIYAGLRDGIDKIALQHAITSGKCEDALHVIEPKAGDCIFIPALNLFANIRPVKIRKSLLDSSSLKKEIIKTVDLIVVRELIGGIYFGQPRGQIINTKIKKAFNTMVYDSKEIERITEVAIKLANQRSKKICSVDKSNVLEVSQLWRDTVLEVVSKDKDLSLSNMYVDNAAMQLVKNPSQFDVILTSNLFGDILSDLAAMITGSIGMLPSASLSNSGPGVFEPVHGSAPDIAGKNIANPIAMALSTSMMLKIGLNESEAAEDIEIAIDNVLSKGYRTSDLNDGNCQVLSCSEIGEKIIQEI